MRPFPRLPRRFPLLALILSLAAMGAPPVWAGDRGVEIVDHGLYRMTTVRREKAPHHVSGERTIVRDIEHLRQTRLINAQLGRVFGFRFRLTDPALHGETFTLRLTFPTLTNPATGKQQTVQEDERRLHLGPLYQQAYGFDYLWEMAEGTWTFQILNRGRVLAEQKFEVVVIVN